jgi:diaminohydroxyphosphoribosylaminopyrimidine deaminase/5-amino-6-(5-phosphoribosylamino)uracil reductase
VTIDERYMERALTLAEATVGLASPNPQVGCVLVREGIVLGEGAHLYDNFDHAEIAALKQAQAAGNNARGATAYVTLEPCSHHGRTGPCADALIAAGIARCVVATGDPNPTVSGRGIARLRDARTEVEVGVLQARARRMNDAFALSITQGRPFVTLKAGLSVDGMLAPSREKRSAAAPFVLTGPQARAEVQQLRHASDAILTGIGTVLADDPLLTDRSGKVRRRQLLRVLLDASLRMPLGTKLVGTAQDDLLVFCSSDASTEREAGLKAAGAWVWRLRSAANRLDLGEVLAHLHGLKITSVLLEAGAALNGAFLLAGLVDRVILYYAETELGPSSIRFAEGFTSPFALEERLKQVRKRTVGADVCVSGLIHDPWSDPSQA